MRRASLLPLLLAALLICVSCSKKQQQAPKSISFPAELVTVEYVVSKAVRIDRALDKDKNAKHWAWVDAIKMGDRKIIYSCKAHIKAGIDLKQVSVSDVVKIDSLQKSATVVLPNAKIFALNMLPDESTVEYEKVGALRWSISQTEKNTIQQIGEDKIKEQINGTDILSQAEYRAKIFFESLLKRAGYSTVNVQFSNNK